jgi:hypothetical protein
MPNITTKLGHYCVIHGYHHDEEYLECDFCNEHKWSIYFHDRYYNYGFSKCSYHACNECHDTFFGPFRPGDVLITQRAYEDILEVINQKTDKKNEGHETTTAATINYYEAARIAYTDREYMKKYLDSEIKDIREINKGYRPLWQFTYKIVSGEDGKRDPDNLQVKWVPGGQTLTEIFREMDKGSRAPLCITSNTYFHFCSVIYNAHRNSINVYW